MPRTSSRRSASKTSSQRRTMVLWGLLVALVFVVGLFVGHLRQVPIAPPEAVAPVAPEPDARNVILYFASADGQTLVAESRSLAGCRTDDDCIGAVVTALVAGPQGGALVAVLPKQVRVRGVTVEDSLASVDFSRELVTAHPGGTQSELLTVYALADTLVANFPYLRQVRLLVEGAPLDTLKGHVDLRQPLYADFSFVEEGPAPVGGMTTVTTGGDE